MINAVIRKLIACHLLLFAIASCSANIKQITLR